MELSLLTQVRERPTSWTGGFVGSMPKMGDLLSKVSVPFTLFWGRVPPQKIDYMKKGTLILTSLLEDLEVTGDPFWICQEQMQQPGEWGVWHRLAVSPGRSFPDAPDQAMVFFGWVWWMCFC